MSFEEPNSLLTYAIASHTPPTMSSRKQSGTLMLYLVKHEKSARGRVSGSDLTDLEHRLIGLAYRRNPDLLNVKGTKGRPPA